MPVFSLDPLCISSSGSKQGFCPSEASRIVALQNRVCPLAKWSFQRRGHALNLERLEKTSVQERNFFCCDRMTESYKPAVSAALLEQFWLTDCHTEGREPHKDVPLFPLCSRSAVKRKPSHSKGVALKCLVQYIFYPQSKSNRTNKTASSRGWAGEVPLTIQSPF